MTDATVPLTGVGLAGGPDSPTPASGPKRSRTVLAAAAAIALVAVNAILVGAAIGATGIRASPMAGEHTRVLTATAVPSGILMVAADGTISVDGDTSVPLAGAQVLSLTATPDGSAALGYSDGSVVFVGDHLEVEGTVALEGRVVALTTTANAVIAASGYGEYAQRYDIAFLDPRTQGVLASTFVGGTVTALTAVGDGIAAGTSVGGLVFLNGDGAVICDTQLNGPVTAAASQPSGGVVVGQDNGVVVSVGRDCGVLWEAQVSHAAIRSLHATDDVVYTGDAVGVVSALDATGKTIGDAKIASSPVRAILVSGGKVVSVPEAGRVAVIDATPPSVLAVAGPWALLALLDFAAVVLVIVLVRRDSGRVRTRRFLRKLWRNRTAYLFVAAPVALIGMFFYFPVGDAIRVSLTNTNIGTGAAEWIGLDNYVKVLFDDPYFQRGLLNLLAFLGAALVKTFSIPLLCAQLVFWLRKQRARSFYRVLLLLPVVVPAIVVTLLWKTIYQPDGGVLNELLAWVGLGDLQRVWLGDESTALAAVLFVGFPFLDAFAFLIFYGGLLQIDTELFEAARLDGASAWRRFLSIDLPLLRPQIAIMALFSVIGAVQGFAGVFILTKGGPNLATYVPALEMYDQIGQGAIAYASTIGIVLAALVLLLTVIFRWRPRRVRS